MRILSWNINGIRAVIKKGFLDWLKKEKPDILCLQEIKIAEAARKKELSEILAPEKITYDIFWNSAKRPGYSGTAVFVKESLKQKLNFGYPKLSFKNVVQVEKLPWDDDGRIQVIDIGKYYLANIYFPNANHELSRLKFKIDFNNKLLRYLKKLEKIKPLVITGDYNVAHKEIDLARPKENIGNPGFTYEEREWMDKFLNPGFKDTFRETHPEKIQYSWWSYRAGARARNIGWRIDYFCVSDKILKNIKKAFILNKVMGSDHCPVGVELL